MRSLLAATLLFSLTACSGGDDKKAEAKKDKEPEGPALKLGDPAPALKASKWLNGPPVAVEPGKVYVIDFWATWCRPCIQAMPHLAGLQREHRAEGLVVVPVTTIEDLNTAKQIEEFVAKRGPKLGVPFAVCETPEAHEAFMKAAGRNGIPCSFVIDKQGRVAFIGHPMELADVLPKVIAGTWKGAADAEAVRKMREEYEEIVETAEDKPAKTLKDLTTFEAKYPDKAKQSGYRVTKVACLCLAGKHDDAKALTESLLPTLAEKKSTELLNALRSYWTDAKLNPEKKHVRLAVAAAEAVLGIEGDKEPMAFAGLAEAQFAAGDKAKAVESLEKAIGLADEPPVKKFLEQQLKKYKDDGK